MIPLNHLYSQLKKSHHYKILNTFFLILICSFTYAQPVLQTYDTDMTGGTGAYDLSAKPAGLAVGDLLLAVACYESGNSQTMSSPNGWTSIAKTDEDSNVGMETFYKIADASDVAASEFTFSLSEDKKWTLAISRITGVDQSDPIDVYSGNDGPGGNPVANSVTTTTDDCLILAIYGNKKDATYTGSHNEVYEIEHFFGQISSQMLETFVQNTAGATGNTTAVPSNKDSWIAQQIAIKGSGPALLNHFRSITTGDYENNTSWERERSDGTWLSLSDTAPFNDSKVTVRTGHIITAQLGLHCIGAHLTVEDGGELNVMN